MCSTVLMKKDSRVLPSYSSDLFLLVPEKTMAPLNPKSVNPGPTVAGELLGPTKVDL